jgi:hypothetical protein
VDFTEELRALEALWSAEGEGGFFCQVRAGRFDLASYGQAQATLGRIVIPPDARLPRRLVSLLWFIPLFMGWNRPRVLEAGGDAVAYERAATALEDAVERLLGIP